MNNHLDPVAAMVTILGLILGPAVGAIIGPYAVIVIASTVGASWAVGRRDPTARVSALMFFVRLVVTALIITVPLAELATAWGAPGGARWMFVPIAILIGGVGDDWPAAGRFILERLGRLIDRKIDNVGAAGGAAPQQEKPSQYRPPTSSFRNRDLDR